MAENIEGRPPILGLGEVVLWVRDLEMSSAFYSEVLDFHIQDVGDGKTAVINVGHPEFADFGQNLTVILTGWRTRVSRLKQGHTK